jgi:uncharacterized Fe-S radical SAM superfamily protein PflX
MSLSSVGKDSAFKESVHPGKWWHAENGRVVCDLCPRNCALKEGQHGFCFVRKNVQGRIALLTYGHLNSLIPGNSNFAWPYSIVTT